MSIFNKISLQKPSSSTFNLSHDRKFSLNMGELTPILCQEIIPGDKFNVTTQQMLRFAPMISPVMHEVNVFTHFFFVPNRLIFDKWEEFITGGENGQSEVLFPTITNLGVKARELGDYLGLPIFEDGGGAGRNSAVGLDAVSRLPFNAYKLIYNEYYRDQNLIEPLKIDKSEGNIDLGYLPSEEVNEYKYLRHRAWQHDYFTSALPFAQKGEAVRLPIQGQADVKYQHSNTADIIRNLDGTLSTSGADRHLISKTDADLAIETGAGNPTKDVNIDNSHNLVVDLESATQSTITDLRRAFKLQEWLEKNARAGSRYVESILAHFGVRSSDARLQRPEYLGGGMSPVLISEVLQTAATQDSTPLAEMAGHGINVNKNHSFNKFFEEHGFVIGIMSVMPKTAYQQGVPRMFSKFNKFDYFWPEFQHIGEQEILNKELVYTGTPTDNETFGYIPRYSEYKFMPSTVHGDFKKTLDFWHMGRIFEQTFPPQLNKDFIEARPTKRIFAVEESEEQVLYCHVYHQITANRKMSYYGDPGFR